MKQKMNEEVELRAALNALGTVTLNEVRAFEEDLAALDATSKAEVEEFDSVASLLAFGASTAEPSADVWGKLCAVMEAEPKAQVAQTEDAQSANATVQETAAASLLTIRKDEGVWQKVHEGIFAKTLFQNVENGTTSYLVKFMPGAKTPLHRHPGREECTIVEGDFQVDGKDLRAGDYHCAMPGSIHERPYSIGGAIVLIVAEGQYQVLEK
jgi:anti-sigma factor ChrR (cupin superfamily)